MSKGRVEGMIVASPLVREKADLSGRKDLGLGRPKILMA